jgi:signal transduction histidine kinase
MTSIPEQPDASPLPASPGGLDQQLLDIFFDQAPMATAIFDREYRLQRCNANWTRFFTELVGVPAEHLVPGQKLFEAVPGGGERMAALLEPVLAGQTVRQAAHRIQNRGAVTYWDVVFSPLFREDAVVAFVAVAVDATERVTAFEKLERRIAAFATVASSMTVDQPIEATLQVLAQTGRQVTDAEACAVVIVDPESDLVTVFEAAGLPDTYGVALAEAWRQGVQSPSREALERQQLTVVTGARAKGLSNPLYEPLHPYLRDAAWDDMVIVPLDSRGRCLGVMQYYHRPGRVQDAEERSFLTAVADQAAVAVANAALYAKSERNAALVERQRLARELHDSVSQALFSMTLHARTAERQLTATGVATDAPAAESVRRLAELTQGALAEMRALIFELRPGALAEEGLVTALTRQAAALTAREEAVIVVSGPDERPLLDADVEEHLYRLTLEAINNAVKHANASCIEVTLTVAGSTLEICVADNGVGFDATVPRPGHLGQATMAERADAVGGSLRVESAPGAGCSVTVSVPLEQRRCHQIRSL